MVTLLIVQPRLDSPELTTTIANDRAQDRRQSAETQRFVDEAYQTPKRVDWKSDNDDEAAYLLKMLIPFLLLSIIPLMFLLLVLWFHPDALMYDVSPDAGSSFDR
ncbi:hypothetical protein [Aporhodopirellula aestuarii]|uniref:Uncharacterized protein n=1 Tax=Aporhodopirellula aestuarii TaxID=2950107 RepID=A0ABT0TZV7_9BACT|nr:hypothetical protein [Aporhodopirellula aestuarii]MCM2370144.1 hypothetical protein [Aporhodopirellula aestuarii]